MFKDLSGIMCLSPAILNNNNVAHSDISHHLINETKIYIT
jgi:hypothetical protein